MILRFLKILFFGTVSFVVAIAIIGFVYEQVSRLIEENNHPPGGMFTDVGGHKLHYMKKGDTSPTVVFESGLGEGAVSWFKIQDKVSEYAATISYDRAGIGWSERGDNPKSVSAISGDLEKLLENADAKKPYVIVLHSFAGLTLRDFITKNSKDISGLIFVDASHPDQFNRLPKKEGGDSKEDLGFIVGLMNEFGIVRLFSDHQYSNTKASNPVNLRLNALSHQSISATMEEMQNFNSIAADAGKISTFGDIPLVVITGASPQRWKKEASSDARKNSASIWMNLQKDLLNLSSNSTHIIANKSGHFVQMDEPEIIIQEIKKMLDKSATK